VALIHLDLDADLGGSLGDPLHGVVHAVGASLGVGRFEQLGNAGSSVRADGRLAGAAQLQFEVKSRATRRLRRWLAGRHLVLLQVALELPIGDVGAVGVPLGLLGVEEVGENVLAQGTRDHGVRLHLGDRLL